MNQCSTVGFKPGHSTTLCTATVMNVVSRYLNNGSPVLGCFLDVSKAFDLVDHRAMCSKKGEGGKERVWGICLPFDGNWKECGGE